MKILVLLGWEDASPCVPGKDSRTPLLRAAGCGQDGIVELLIGTGGRQSRYAKQAWLNGALIDDRGGPCWFGWDRSIQV